MKSRGTIVSVVALTVVVALAVAGCGGSGEEVTVEEAEAQRSSSRNELLEQTVSKPGPGEWEQGSIAGEWVTSINNDPKTFNTLTARDGDTRDIVDVLFDYLAEYDPYEREFIPNLASFEIEVDREANSLRVIYTLRDDLYWSTPDSSEEEWVRVTSDDVIFWYDEIQGDPEFQLPGYPGQFVDMPDGEQARVTVERIDDRSFAFNFPRIVANPVLSTNMTFGPSHLYRAAKEEGGVEAVLNLLSVDTEVTTIPSIGPYHIVEYTPGVRVVLERNPQYWKEDESGTGIPYVRRAIYRVVPDQNTEFLLFKDGTKDAYSARPEDLEELLSAENPDYTVYNGGESLGASFFTFNQNPENLDPTKHAWFTQKQFRQAMSSLFNRPRIAQQVYRGLAAPAHHFFARANPMFDPEISLEYTYNPDRAVELLAEIGITEGDDGLMYDEEGNHLEFTVNVGTESTIGIDMANIFADELEQVGITANVRPIDFQRLVEMLTSTFDWEAVFVALGANYWPSGGSNVWQSSGNFHLWHPLQEEPATEWESRVDELYNEGRFTLGEATRKEIYDEYQQILLEQLPVIYTVHPFSFLAIRDKWANVYYDTLNGLETERVFLTEE